MIPRLVLGKTTIGPISRKELAEIREQLKHTPRRTLSEIRWVAEQTIKHSREG
jgi:hypothetical protein